MSQAFLAVNIGMNWLNLPARSYSDVISCGFMALQNALVRIVVNAV